MKMFGGGAAAKPDPSLEAARKEAKQRQAELEAQQQDASRRRGSALLYSGSALGFPTLGSASSLGGTS